MARKKTKVDIHDDKKMETVYNFGDVKIVTKWDDVTLQMMCDLWKLKSDKEALLEEDMKKAKQEKKEAPDDSLDKYNVTDKDLLGIFSTIDPEKIDILPVEFYERLLGSLSFMVTSYETTKPSKQIVHDGKTFIVNDMETLKVKEYKDADTILINNKFDYPSLLAVLCRLKTGTHYDHVTGISWDVNEEYTDEFANKVFDARREMFAKMPIAKVMPIISFFLLKGAASSQVSQKSLQTLGRQLRELAENIENSAESMDLSRWSKIRVKRTMRKYKKQIDNILSTT